MEASREDRSSPHPLREWIDYNLFTLFCFAYVIPSLSRNLKISLLSRIKYIFRIILLLCHSEWRRSRNWRISDNRSLSKDKTFRIVILNRYIIYFCKKWLCNTLLSVVIYALKNCLFLVFLSKIFSISFQKSGVFYFFASLNNYLVVNLSE